jgi:DNA end-binding protein Ku
VASDLREGEIKVAQQLIEALAGKWDPAKYHDTFESNLRTLIQARVEGREVSPVEKPRKPAPVVDLMDALRQSLEQMQKKPPQRVAEAQAGSETVPTEHSHVPRKRASSRRAKPAA